MCMGFAWPFFFDHLNFLPYDMNSSAGGFMVREATIDAHFLPVLLQVDKERFLDILQLFSLPDLPPSLRYLPLWEKSCSASTKVFLFISIM